MSISFGMVGKGYSIVAADTRTTNLKTGTCKDNAQKTIMYKYGWVANSGSVSLGTSLFNQYLHTNEIKNRSDIYKSWLLSIKGIHQFAEKHVDAEICKLVDSETSSSQAVYSLNFFKDGIAYMSVEAIDFAYKMRKLTKVNSLVVNPPKDTKRIKRAIEKYSELMKSTSGLYESIYLIACCINEISKYTNWINNTVDMGISLQISETEILLMNIHENAKIIKKLYKKKHDLSEIMIVRKVIQC